MLYLIGPLVSAYILLFSKKCYLMKICRLWRFNILHRLMLSIYKHTLPKCPGGHPILHRKFKDLISKIFIRLNSKISVKKYKKIDIYLGQLIFYQRAKQNLNLKIQRFHKTKSKTLAKIQSTREASHQVTLMDNCQTFYSQIFVFM